MRNIIPPGRSLKFYTLMSWTVSALIAVVACITLFLAFSGIAYHGEVRRIQNDLSEKTNTVARRISAEMLMGERGAVKSVSELLKSELSISDIQITSMTPDCISATEATCVIEKNHRILVARKIPVIPDNYYVITESVLPSFRQFFDPRTLLWSILPIALMFAIGLMFQRFILRRYILKPVQALVDTTTGTTEPQEYWPQELQDISKGLNRAFEVRDVEIFSQIARGVIHDLRTLIHTPLAAVELVHEASDEKRAKRLEQLLSVTEQQLPKMKAIIDNTLDGSREITVSKRASTISSAIEGANKTLSALSKQAGVELKFSSSNTMVVHDSLQLERAITNVIKNGIEACQENKRENRIVSLNIFEDSEKLSINIEDSGSGLKIPHGKLFRPLKSTKTHGSGLGLIVTKKIVEAHGGALSSSNSKELGGAKFTISLPINGEATL